MNKKLNSTLFPQSDIFEIDVKQGDTFVISTKGECTSLTDLVRTERLRGGKWYIYMLNDKVLHIAHESVFDVLTKIYNNEDFSKSNIICKAQYEEYERNRKQYINEMEVIASMLNMQCELSSSSLFIKLYPNDLKFPDKNVEYAYFNNPSSKNLKKNRRQEIKLLINNVDDDSFVCNISANRVRLAGFSSEIFEDTTYIVIHNYDEDERNILEEYGMEILES